VFDRNMERSRSAKYAQLFARVSLAVGFLSAVADRFGFWGPPGAPRVAWGSFDRFLRYTHRLNPWAPEMVVPALGWFVTIAEVVLAIWLLIGWRLKHAAIASGVLLFLFALGMVVGSGVKAPLDASVFAASAAAFLVASSARDADRAA
jgi:putative oxidoreductase